nr:hypothetical protein CFP56_25681 [Quercus suber]
MEQAVLDGLQNLLLTKEEEKCIQITNQGRAELLKDWLLSLFGKLLSSRLQNQQALKGTLRAAWKMGSDLRILEVGNGILQFKFGSRYQMEWVEKNGPWNFDNNLLLLCRWRKGLSAANITFTHSSFWVQVWGLPFELLSEETGKDIGNSIGIFVETDKRSGHTNQAKFMLIRVELQLDKPLRRGRYGEWLKANGSFNGNQYRVKTKKNDNAESSSGSEDARQPPAQAEMGDTATAYGGGIQKSGGFQESGKAGDWGSRGNDGRSNCQEACPVQS